MKFSKIYLTISLLFVFSLSFAQITTQTLLKGSSGLAASREDSSPRYFAIKWYRNSAEKNAIYREVFSMAEQTIKLKLAKHHLRSHHWGVILDIDETTLDNSAWNYQREIAGINQPREAFMAEASSVATPGVKKFTHTIHRMGGYVNFVSNRPISLLAATKKNLNAQGIYFDQILLTHATTLDPNRDKNHRFEAIISGREPSHLPRQIILAWVGDNIQDFPHLKQSDMINQDANGSAYEQFGTSFFLVPNPMYGSWENNTFN